MGWYYKAKRFDMGYDTYEYGLVEYYPELDAHTEQAVHVFADSPQELAEWLRKAADDVEKYGVVDDDN